MEKPDKEMRFQDFHVRYYRGVGQLDDDTCDRMIIEYPRGKREDVGIFKKDGRHLAAWWRQALKLAPGSSVANPVTSSGAWFLEAMDEQNQKRLLLIYGTVQSEP